MRKELKKWRKKNEIVNKKHAGNACDIVNKIVRNENAKKAIDNLLTLVCQNCKSLEFNCECQMPQLKSNLLAQVKKIHVSLH